MVLDAKKIDKVIIFGHSFGTWFGNTFILNHPTRVRGFIQICGIVNEHFVGFEFMRSILTRIKIFTDCDTEKAESRMEYWEKFEKLRL